jgi:hypothetical protein
LAVSIIGVLPVLHARFIIRFLPVPLTVTAIFLGALKIVELSDVKTGEIYIRKNVSLVGL